MIPVEQRNSNPLSASTPWKHYLIQLIIIRFSIKRHGIIEFKPRVDLSTWETIKMFQFHVNLRSDMKLCLFSISNPLYPSSFFQITAANIFIPALSCVGKRFLWIQKSFLLLITSAKKEENTKLPWCFYLIVTKRRFSFIWRRDLLIRWASFTRHKSMKVKSDWMQNDKAFARLSKFY